MKERGWVLEYDQNKGTGFVESHYGTYPFSTYKGHDLKIGDEVTFVVHEDSRGSFFADGVDT